MPTLFNTVRTCIYRRSLIAAFISQPFSLNVRLGFSFFLRERNPISTRIELGCLGLAGLLFLAVRRHRKGDEHMWHGPVTSCAWFNDYGKKQQTRSQSQRSILPTQQAQTREVTVAPLTAPPVPSKQRHRSSRSRGHSQSRRGGPYAERYPSSRSHGRQASGSTSTNDIESGVMRNPNRIAAGPRVANR
ncbi:uncharacterized protein EV420DRAFT_1474058 [Desarmillaria tabescens]|uniref:Uncharacterized protein n=1 Tax=Armillaria tabescens TaxID=1929756 RepID=A0AA39NMI1_ARMTA|nr:uncharacterized protein EV420DRAFT_1474058 [Desarmillaria tabescens]KAK0468384.1 hypothetical protein EV420DRAFT_1474058 [Desarmillaria tabescens]